MCPCYVCVLDLYLSIFPPFLSLFLSPKGFDALASLLSLTDKIGLSRHTGIEDRDREKKRYNFVRVRILQRQKVHRTNTKFDERELQRK